MDIKTLLPVGEKLKPLLNKSCISDSDLKDILINRGVFIGTNNKKSTIPLLTLSLISPPEFEKLQELQRTKEDSLKIHTLSVDSLTQTNLNSIIPLDLISSENLQDNTDSFQFNSDLYFYIESPNKLILDYEILREDVTKDWANSGSLHSGRVEIYKNISSNNLTFKSQFTSPETEVVNKKIINSLSKHLKEKNEISTNSSLTSISSDKFNNKTRFSFMLKLANNSTNGFLEFQAVKNIEIGPDKDCTLPYDAKWMGDGVKNIIINSDKGETLQNVEYISNKTYHDVLILRQIQAQYKYKFDSVEGNCIIEYGFPHYFRNKIKDNCFEASVSRIYFVNNSKGNIRSTSRKILDEFEETVSHTYKDILKK